MFLSFLNSLRGRAAIKRAPFAALGAGFWVFLYIGTVKVLWYIRGVEYLGELFSERLFSMTFFSLSAFLVLSNVITSISSFYLSEDIPFLFSKPVGIPEILRYKTFVTVLNSSWMVLVFLSPVLIAYGVSYGAPLLYYVLSFAALILFLLITAGAGIPIAHLLVRFFPARRSREVLIASSIILFLFFYFAVKSVLLTGQNTPEAIINSFVGISSESPFLPHYWFTKAVFPLLKGKGPDLFYCIVLFCNAAFFLLISQTAGTAFYRSNREKIIPSEHKPVAGLSARIYPGHDPALFYKDVITFFRDAGQWSQILVILALVAVYLYNFRSLPLETISGLSPFAKEIMVMINLAMAGLVLSAVAARFLYTSLSLEGRAFWVIRTSPVNPHRLLWQKFLYGCIPLTFLIVTLVLLTNSALNVKGPLMFLSAGTTLLLCISISGLATGLGATYPKFRYENIASVSVSLGGMVFMLISFGVVTATILLESRIFYLHVVRQAEPDVSDLLQIVACAISILAINACAFYLPMRSGERKIMEDATELDL